MRLGYKPRSSKYGAKKTVVDGVEFQSKHEAERYVQLKHLKKLGLIQSFELQPKYIIIDSYRCPSTGRKIPATTYTADFLVTYPDGHQEVEDVKSEATRKKDAYRIKRKAFEQRYGMGIKEIL